MATLTMPASALPRPAAGAYRRAPTAMWAVAAALLKVRIVGLVVFTGLAAALVAAPGRVAGGELALFALAGTLAASGAAVLNHYLDRHLDARMARTRGRPLPAGHVRPATALLLGLGLVGASLPLAMVVHPTLPAFVLQGALVYLLVYTWWLKRRTPHSVVIGGWTGSCAVLGGWAMTGAPLSLSAWALAATVFFWTPPHFWALALVRDADYRAAGIPTLPATAGPAATARAIAAGAGLTLAISLVPWLAGDLGPIYALAALCAGGMFVGRAAALCRQVTAARAWRLYRLSGPYLLVLFVAMLLDVAVR